MSSILWYSFCRPPSLRSDIMSNEPETKIGAGRCGSTTGSIIYELYIFYVIVNAWSVSFRVLHVFARDLISLVIWKIHEDEVVIL